MIKIYGGHDAATIDQLNTCMGVGSASRGVLCADGHLGYNHPIGGVVGYTDHISLSGVGFDIACGNYAVKLDVKFEEIKHNLPVIMSDIASVISFGVGRKNKEKVDHELFEWDDLWDAAGVSGLKKMAREQLGTVGSGNHYVDIFRDEDDWVWIGVHFGSRGLGHKITTKFMKEAGARDVMLDPPCLLEVGTDIAGRYIQGLTLAGAYAYAGREWVVEKVRSIIGGHTTFHVHNHHNFCWYENHFNEDLWVVRKGATPAFPGQYGFVGGSMGDNAVILKGIESEESKASLYSTVHGAGRVMSRTDARGKVNKAGEVIREPQVKREEWESWVQEKGVTVIGGDLDEAPQAYRRLPEVLEHHKNTVEIVHTLAPVGVIMAGANEFDPYKD